MVDSVKSYRKDYCEGYYIEHTQVHCGFSVYDLRGQRVRQYPDSVTHNVVNYAELEPSGLFEIVGGRVQPDATGLCHLSHLGGSMTWEPKVKKYPHFDPPISNEFADAYVRKPANIVSHAFWPFIKFSLRWTKFAKKGEKGSVKEREIKFAARLDACIFSYYRSKLSSKYEALLDREGLTNQVLAYRRVLKPTGGGKCNIDFAKDAFEVIKGYEQCHVYALDISKFYENLEHRRIKRQWGELNGSEILPADEMAVFKAITKYTYVEKSEAYKRLGLLARDDGKEYDSYILSSKEMAKKFIRLCSAEDFRSKIAGQDGKLSIIQKNPNGARGVPQGAPLSDLLANLYMIDADRELRNFSSKFGGVYMRYSDDILLIIPNEQEPHTIYANILAIINQHCGGLDVSPHKTSVIKFERVGNRLEVSRELEGVKGSAKLVKPEKPRSDGLEYLGFRFDGSQVFVRNSTISNLDRKITLAARRAAFAHVKRYRDRSEAELVDCFNFEKFGKKFSRVEDFSQYQDDPKYWTFWTYIKRSIATFSEDGASIHKQFKAFQTRIEKRVTREIGRAYRTVHKEELKKQKAKKLLSAMLPAKTA